MSEAPDTAGPVVGWRVWRLGVDAEGPTLLSPVAEHVWPARAATTASCRLGCGEPPTWGCACGLYATRDLVPLAAYLASTVVLGCVALWGRTVEATHGWRAEHAYPVVLFLPTADVRGEDLGTAAMAAHVGLDRAAPRPYVGPQDAGVRAALGDRYGVAVHPLPGGWVHPPPWSRARTTWHASPTSARPAAELRAEAALGLPARRLGDGRAEQRLADAVERFVTAMRPRGGPPPVAV